MFHLTENVDYVPLSESVTISSDGQFSTNLTILDEGVFFEEEESLQVVIAYSVVDQASINGSVTVQITIGTIVSSELFKAKRRAPL